MELYYLIALLAATLVVVLWLRRTTPAELAKADLLRSWVSSQLVDLTDEQKEAVNIFAAAEQNGWVTLSRRLHSYPLAKEALNVQG
jgi:hypothetical protein